MLDLVRRESYAVSQYLDTNYPSHRTYNLQVITLQTLAELNRMLTILDPCTTPVKLYNPFTKLLHTIMTMVNIATATSLPPPEIAGPIFNMFTTVTALYMYNRSLFTPENRGYVENIAKTRKARLEAQYMREQFYINMTTFPEIILPPNHYSHKPEVTLTINHDIITTRLLDYWKEKEIKEPPKEKIDLLTWIASFADLLMIPEMPLTEATRLILKAKGNIIKAYNQIKPPPAPTTTAHTSKPAVTTAALPHQPEIPPAQIRQPPPPIQASQQVHMAIPMYPNPEQTQQYPTYQHVQQFVGHDPSYTQNNQQFMQQAALTQHNIWQNRYTQTLGTIAEKVQQLIEVTKLQSENFQLQLEIIRETIANIKP